MYIILCYYSRPDHAYCSTHFNVEAQSAKRKTERSAKLEALNAKRKAQIGRSAKREARNAKRETRSAKREARNAKRETRSAKREARNAKRETRSAKREAQSAVRCPSRPPYYSDCASQDHSGMDTRHLFTCD